MMSEDGFSDSSDEPHIEIQVQTLMGTTVDIKLSPRDTVAAIKKKIYRVEGIPVHQQNLVYRNEELKDTSVLLDIGIQNGSKLTLISSMRGGPISTRRLSISCEHILLKELKDLLDNTRDDIMPGAKVSVLVVKGGEVINLLRVIENEDGSYSPYSNEGPISPPSKSRNTLEAFKRLVEESEMKEKVAKLKRRMEQVNDKRLNRNTKSDYTYNLFEGTSFDNLDLTVFEKLNDEVHLENEEEIALKDKHRTKPKVLQSLPLLKANQKSIYSDRKGAHSHTRQNYVKMSKRREVAAAAAAIQKNPDGSVMYCRDRQFSNSNFDNSTSSHSENPYLLNGLHSNKTQDLRILDTDDFLPELDEPDHLLETALPSTSEPASRLLSDIRLNPGYSLTSNSLRMSQSREYRNNYSPPLEPPLLGNLRNSFSTDSGRESPCLGATGGGGGGTSVEEVGAKLAEQLHLLDEKSNTGDLYGESLSMSTRNRVHLTRLVLAAEGADRPKSASDGLELDGQDLWEISEPASERLKRSATCKVGLLKRRPDYNYDNLDNPKSSLNPELNNVSGYKSSSDFGVCSGANYFMPQYLASPSAIPPQYAPKHHHHQKYCDFLFRNEPRSPLYSRRNSRRESLVKDSPDGDCSSIERLKNDDNLLGVSEINNNLDLFGYYNLGCAASDLLERIEEKKEPIKLPPVVKKKSRCNECNKRLNITNIYNCRCGRIFCSQHRYSEVHRCTYDYKTDGRKILERQNPLVTADKVQRF